eukprot:355418-Chlamydomonas_euryale.AAC.2
MPSSDAFSARGGFALRRMCDTPALRMWVHPDTLCHGQFAACLASSQVKPAVPSTQSSLPIRGPHGFSSWAAQLWNGQAVRKGVERAPGARNSFWRLTATARASVCSQCKYDGI